MSEKGPGAPLERERPGAVHESVGFVDAGQGGERDHAVRVGEPRERSGDVDPAVTDRHVIDLDVGVDVP